MPRIRLFLQNKMNRSRSKQIKAAFLVLVFSINTIVGFACALGVDMGFNATHHHDEAAAETVQVHANGKKHIHHKDEAGEDDHHQKKSNDGDDNCCNKHVTAFSTVDKSVLQSVSVPHPIFFTALVSAFYNADIFSFPQSTPNTNYFVRSHHPPIPDIRIAIRSFLI